MKKISNLTFLGLIFSFSLSFSIANAQNAKSYTSEITKAINLIKSRKNISAAQLLLSLSKVATISSQKARIKYLLGISFMEINLNQTAAIQFVEVIRSGDVTWTKLSIEKLLIVTDRLGDETLLNFAVQRADINQIPEASREILYFRLAEIKHKLGSTADAIDLYAKVTSKSRYFFSALYNMGLAQAETNQPAQALQSFNRLLESRKDSGITDTNKVTTQMAIARTLYQSKNWNKSIEAYSKIPRDHALWHDALFEKTWAMLRAARFRSTLSNFQSLHSSFYEDFYLPETLLLRAIVYLYICQYDEMDKVLSLYEKQYAPVLDNISLFLQNTNLESYFLEINKTYQMKKSADNKKQFLLPYNVLKHIAEEGDVRRSHAYLKKIYEEKLAIEVNALLKNSAVGSYAKRIVNNRIKNAKLVLGEMVKNHLIQIKDELTDLSEQSSYIRYEMINGRKEALKKKTIAINLSGQESNTIPQQYFDIQDGYEYYPFQGEYWLDEIGNYHFLGKQSCE